MHIAHVRREPSLLEPLNHDKERSDGGVRIHGMERTVSSNIFVRVSHPTIKLNVRRVTNCRVNSDHRRITAYHFSEDAMFKLSPSDNASIMELNILTAYLLRTLVVWNPS